MTNAYFRYDNEKLLVGIIYFHRISDFRVGGISKRNIEVFHQLCGREALKNATIVTNMWREVTPKIGYGGEKQLRSDDNFFAPAISAGAKFHRHDNTEKSAEAILRELIYNNPLALQIQVEMVERQQSLDQTAAGGILFRDLKEQE